MSRHNGRPQLHLTADQGWINDPLGLTYHGGKYHLFYQYVPGRTDWAPNCHWGHATSDDLLHWSPEPVALAPGDGDDGCWSGSVVTPAGKPASLFYTTVSLSDVQIGQVRVAHPDDEDWTTWTKGDVLAELPPGIKAIAYRDPFVFHDGDRWRMLMGAGLQDGTAVALVHSSTDLRDWAYDGELVSRHTSQTEPLWMGSVWECPQVFPLGDKWVLTVSVWEPYVPHYEAYAIGTYVDSRFTPEHWGRLTYGPSYYAGSTFVDATGRRGLIYWLRGVDDTEAGWASANSVPHLLSLDGDTLIAGPHPNVEALRGAELLFDPAAAITLSTLVDIEWTAESATAGADLEIRDPAGDVVLGLHHAGGTLQAVTAEGTWTMPARGDRIRLLIDGPVCEVFTEAGTMALPLPSVAALTGRISGAGHASAYNLKTDTTTGQSAFPSHSERS